MTAPSAKELLEQEIDAVQRLILLLEKELAALKSGTPESLAEIGPQKSGLIDLLNRLELQRDGAIGRTGGTPARAAMESWLAKEDHDGTVRQLWEKLLLTAKQAKTLNELNGKVVNIHLQQTNQALSVLSRQTSDELYGSDGQSSLLTGSRIVDSA